MTGSAGRQASGGALVLGGDYWGLAIVRSLGRRGVPVWVLGDSASLASFSRYARRTLPWPMGSEERQRDYLLELARRWGLVGWTILPLGDETAALLAREHAALSERFLLPASGWETLRWACDKRLTYRLAAELGIDHPWTVVPGSREELVAGSHPFPLILKPGIKEETNAFTAGKVWQAPDRRTLLNRYDEACGLVPSDSILVQELIPGGANAQFSFAALCLDGVPLVWAEAVRRRQYPPGFGVSTFVETIEQPAIRAPARRLLAAMRYTGLVDMEFKWDQRDSRYKLLDVNARPWGWLALGSQAGVDFPWLLWQMLHGRTVRPRAVTAGMRWIHAVPDLQAALLMIRRGELTAGAYVRSLGGNTAHAVLALDDPMPALLELPLLWARRRRSRRSP